MLRWNQPQKKRVFTLQEGSADERNVFGEKGANLCEMNRIGLPIPAAFIITTEACNEFFAKKPDTGGDSLFDEIKKAVHGLEKKTGQAFFAEGCAKRDEKKLPLLISVRSAAPVNLPGMTETVLNIGINDEVVDFMIRVSDNSRWALDTQRRFLQMFGSVVMGVEKEKYENIMIEARAKANAEHNSLLDSNDLANVIRQFKGLAEVPDDPWEQLRMCVEAVFNSWYSPAARRFRDVNSLAEEMGVAVIVQKMVYGNLNLLSGVGVASTRDYLNGASSLNGKFLRNAAGEEVIDPTRQSRCITLEDLGLELPKVHEKLVSCARTLESHYRDMQDIEFTIENQELYILETNKGRRTARASVNMVVSMVEDKIITEREALLRLQPEQMNFFLHPMIDNLKVDVNDEATRNRVLGRGVSASIGAVAGRIAFTTSQVMEFASKNESAIFVKYDTSCTEDLVGMRGSVGCITMLGGYTSHAALVMRSMGKPCITALGEDHKMTIDVLGDCLIVKKTGKKLQKGDIVTVDGATGTLYEGELPIVMAAADENFQKVMHWADKYKRMRVFCNTRTLHDVNLASRLGVEGVGLARTEHMFFADDRVDHVRKAILSETKAGRMEEMMKLLPLQQQDFVDMFLVMQHRPILVRLLDRNLSDFLPNPQAEDFENEVITLSNRIGVTPERCFERIQELHESNPTLGNRGSRLAISYPEFIVLQTEAIVGAALELRSHHITVKPQMLLPLICTDHEVDLITPIITKACDKICARMWADSAYQSAYIECGVGALVELPRACLRADKIAKAKQVDFMSIGTNELTQLMFGFSREDAHHFMPSYEDKHLVSKNPFVSIDIAGVGTMVQTALERARKANHAIKIGICGDHCGDPASVQFFEHIGIDYISCSPFKVPIAKMAAAQAHIKETTKIQLQRQRSAPRMF